MIHALLTLAVLAVLGWGAWRLVRNRRAMLAEIERLERQNDIVRVLLTDRSLRGVTTHVGRTAASLLGADHGHVALLDDKSHTEPRGTLTVPLMVRGRSIGTLGVDPPHDGREYSDADHAQLRDLAEYAALAIEAIQAIEELRDQQRTAALLYRTVEHASRELASKISELERANRLKTQFLANMSHELRTPLNSVIGFSEILLAGLHGGRLTHEQRDALEIIARNGRHLLNLVNDVLDLSKVDAGRMELNLVSVDLKRVTGSVLSGIESLVSARGHLVRVEIPDGLVVRADETRARQVLFNLLSNAVKFTPPGGSITISARRDNGVAWLGVTDTGIGITPEDQVRLFSEFTQVDATNARRYEGTGLGLALCKRFMDLHGGRIGVESAPGKGSTFWLEFPVRGPSTPRPEAAS